MNKEIEIPEGYEARIEGNKVIIKPIDSEKEKMENVVINGKVISHRKISSGPVGQNATIGSRIFDILNYLIVTLVALTTIFPFVYIIGASFATEYEIATRPLFIIPQDVTTSAYEFIFSSNKILRGFGNSVFITVCGTAITMSVKRVMNVSVFPPR